MLLAALDGYNILKLSFDSYSSYFLYEAYNEIGISQDRLKVILADYKPLDKHYLDYIYLFHRENYNTKKVERCITGVISVYNKLFLILQQIHF